ncbi:hypothetical protein M2390_002919 [Mycetocola sp. BIGb0189]|uniref:hypothetical protein n=1 Tax=Mycetocola sp. BIGb0189 TaxID=2940604 RepID=UPI002169CD16|nr:hypothetical protein [Mycetocola sp. BIGb0189]MCS4277710.1 hypothetical protein [Mycetocola sp. BIGb0189]
MAANSTDPTTGRPMFIENQAVQVGADLDTVSRYASENGNRVALTTAERQAFKYGREGLECWDKDEKREYLWTGGAFRRRSLLTSQVQVQQGFTSPINRLEKDADGWVTVTYQVTRDAFSGIGQQLGTLPAGFRPSLDVPAAGSATSGAPPGLCTVLIQSNGAMVLYATGNGNRTFYVTARYFAP